MSKKLKKELKRLQKRVDELENGKKQLEKKKKEAESSQLPLYRTIFFFIQNQDYFASFTVLRFLIIYSLDQS